MRKDNLPKPHSVTFAIVCLWGLLLNTFAWGELAGISLILVAVAFCIATFLLIWSYQ